VIGGTHQPMSPAAEYLEHVYAPAMRRFGATVAVEYGPAGYYPRGGGRLRALLDAAHLRGIDAATRGARTSLDAFVVTSRLPGHVADRGAAAVAALLPEACVEIRAPGAFSPGAAVTIVAAQEGGLAGFSSIGRPGLPMETVATAACEEFLSWDATDAACDEHLADQLVLPACVAGGPSRWTTPRVTQHLRTVLAVADKFVPIAWSIEGNRVEVSPASSMEPSSS
jgi:RNA 3'-terminal phosphate cyclase (ATP)